MAAPLVRLEVPVMIGVSAVALGLGLDGAIGRSEGLLLMAGAVAYTVFQVRQSRREGADVRQEFAREFGGTPTGLGLDVGRVMAGCFLLVLGARWLVEGAVVMARALGVSELVIGLTVVAVGTSLPELATSVLAAVRGERDIALGNVVGSSISSSLRNPTPVSGCGGADALRDGASCREVAVRCRLRWRSISRSFNDIGNLPGLARDQGRGSWQAGMRLVMRIRVSR